MMSWARPQVALPWSGVLVEGSKAHLDEQRDRAPQRLGTGLGSSRVVGYVSDFIGVLGEVERQKAVLLVPLSVYTTHRIVADFGWLDASTSCPPNLFRLIKRARARLVDVVVVEDVRRFAKVDAAAVRIAAILCDVGVQIREVGVKPSPVVHAPAAIRGPVPRRRKGRLPVGAAGPDSS